MNGGWVYVVDCRSVTQGHAHPGYQSSDCGSTNKKCLQVIYDHLRLSAGIAEMLNVLQCSFELRSALYVVIHNRMPAP